MNLQDKNDNAVLEDLFIPEETETPKPPRPIRNNLPKRAKNLSKAQLLQALKKKKECNAKAQSVVLKCLDGIAEEDFISMLKDINQCHYDDIVVERALIKICGYPLCPNELPEMPKQHYKISTTSNKVFELSERRNFCSSICFKQSNYIKDQMLTSPLWVRDQEDIPEFKLLSIS